MLMFPSTLILYSWIAAIYSLEISGMFLFSVFLGLIFWFVDNLNLFIFETFVSNLVLNVSLIFCFVFALLLWGMVSIRRRKKKCIRYMDGADEADHSEDNLGSAGSVGETRSPDSKVDDDDGASSDSDAGAADDDDGGATSASDLGLSSPGLSLSSLASPAILPSPSTSLASPCPLTPSPATPSSASYTTSGHDAIIGIIGKSSLITAQTSLSAASSSSSSSSSSGNGSTPGLPFGLYNMLPGPSPSGSGHSHHSVHHSHHHHSHHPHHPVPTGQQQQHQNSHHQHQQQQQQQHHHGMLLPPANLPHRHPIGTNPHDINNPLSVNQLTGQCSSNSNKDKAHSSVSKASDTNSHAIVSVTWWNHNSSSSPPHPHPIVPSIGLFLHKVQQLWRGAQGLI